MNTAQFVVALTTPAMKAAGVAASAPCDTTAPVAAVSFSAADSVPVAKVIVDAGPVLLLSKTKAPLTLSKVTAKPGDVKAAWMMAAALLKLLAAARSTAAAVVDTPLIDSVSVPDRACSCASVSADTSPPRRKAPTATAGYCANSSAPGLTLLPSKPLK